MKHTHTWFYIERRERVMDKAYLVVDEIKTNTIKVMKTSDFNDNYADYEPLAEADTEEEATALMAQFK